MKEDDNNIIVMHVKLKACLHDNFSANELVEQVAVLQHFPLMLYYRLSTLVIVFNNVMSFIIIMKQ